MLAGGRKAGDYVAEEHCRHYSIRTVVQFMTLALLPFLRRHYLPLFVLCGEVRLSRRIGSGSKVAED